jgi:hypothetical protein
LERQSTAHASTPARCIAAGSSVCIRSLRISGQGLGSEKGEGSGEEELVHDAIISIIKKRTGSERIMCSEIWLHGYIENSGNMGKYPE